MASPMLTDTEIMQIRRGDSVFRVHPQDHAEFWHLVNSGKWEPETFVVFDRFLDPRRSYIDIGSWIGPTLLYGYAKARKAYGIEADPIAFSELAANVALNDPANVTILPIAITPGAGKTSFGSRADGGDSESSLLFSGERTVWQVDGIRLQDLVEQHGIEDCTFLKMDVEGGEYSIIPSSADFLRRKFRPTILLSLHPCFLGPLSGRPVDKFRRLFARLRETISVVRSLRHYRRIYDDMGYRISGLTVIRRSLRSTHFAAVWTDEDWHIERQNGKP